jgi:hypothetical protein
MNGSMAVVAAFALVSFAAVVGAAPAGDDSERVVRVAEGFSAARPDGAAYKAPGREERRTSSKDLVVRSKGFSSLATSVGNDFWIYDASTELLFDVDGDGYYHYLRVRFDVDTYFESAYVYAMVFLSDDGETWEHLTSTDDFLIEGATALDEYEVETELVSGYPAAQYDVLIEIYDADFGDFVAEFGPAESSDFALLPLEDAERDGVGPPTVIVEDHGGGAASWLLLLLAAGALIGRRLGATHSADEPSCARMRDDDARASSAAGQRLERRQRPASASSAGPLRRWTAHSSIAREPRRS